uniref:ATP synthase subunit 8 n=1 Tax=Microcos paniculata TaxID=197124 RepID=UPI003001A15B|nr:ATP synthase subunit 8 [Microcos paniculata]WRW54471.1 ATP synthase subunit 8 [Microcos paniculata]
MPQLDKFTYFSQFFWLCLFLFTFYIPICNDGDGVLGISRILKLRNQLLSHRGNKIRSNEPNSLEDILRKGFSTGLSYMYSSLFEVSQWCKAVDLLGKRRKITLISCFGEISGSRGMEKNILYLISKSSSSASFKPGWWITCNNDIMLVHVPHGQGIVHGQRRRRRVPLEMCKLFLTGGKPKKENEIL